MTTSRERATFKARVTHWAHKLGVEVESVTIRDMKRKWASCSTRGRLTFDSEVVVMPTELQDCVIVHELLHFSVPNHGRLWKSLMRAHLGDYEVLEAQLSELSSSR